MIKSMTEAVCSVNNGNERTNQHVSKNDPRMIICLAKRKKWKNMNIKKKRKELCMNVKLSMCVHYHNKTITVK